MNRASSSELFARAKNVIPGGVNSPARAFGAVGGEPIFFDTAHGAVIVDDDGNRFIDYVGSWGPFILGHQHPAVIDAIERQLEKATSFGAPTRLEVIFAELLCGLIPGLDRVRMVSSGTEATMSAVRVARGYTGRNRIIKFEGCYHGHGDSFLIRAGSGLLTHGEPNSPGVTPGAAADTLVATYNDIESVRQLVNEHKSEIAAIIIEPVAGNMGVVPATGAFLAGLRTICDESGILLIFDEVMSGFRIALRGAAEIYGITPDLYTFGKIIGGGLPAGAYGGKEEIMNVVSPVGPVYQAGTLSGNPLAMAAGLATVAQLVDGTVYERLERAGSFLEEGIHELGAELSIPITVNRVGSMITLFFTEGPVQTYRDAIASDTERFARFFHAMLEQGFYLPPSQFEAWFISAAHTDQILELTLNGIRHSLATLHSS